MSVTIHELLIAAGTKFRKDLLTMPVAELAPILKYMSLKTGMQGKEVGGILTTDAQLRPYRTDKGASDNTAINPFEWETFLGDVVKEFDPNAILGTLYTEATSKKPDQREIARLVAMEMARKVGEALRQNMFTAVRDGAGDTTADLFNGFSTLLTAAKTANKLTAALNNYQDLTGEAMTSANCGDILKESYRAMNPLLKGRPVNLYLPDSVLDMYEDWYQIEHGHAPWNDGFDQSKKTLIGSRGKCSFVPLDNMEGQPYAIFTVKENMKVGVDQESDKETVEIRRPDNPKLVQFFMMAYFGVGFETLDKRFMNVIEINTGEEAS
ncbi:MAG: hypothetical protein FD170_3362 [Bacteroidetes bacterium]|nr:MAG: hypothetical protein FD170_3362 [Bacteroidota bacterium]